MYKCGRGSHNTNWLAACCLPSFRSSRSSHRFFLTPFSLLNFSTLSFFCLLSAMKLSSSFPPLLRNVPPSPCFFLSIPTLNLLLRPSFNASRYNLYPFPSSFIPCFNSFLSFIFYVYFFKPRTKYGSIRYGNSVCIRQRQESSSTRRALQ